MPRKIKGIPVAAVQETEDVAAEPPEPQPSEEDNASEEQPP